MPSKVLVREEEGGAAQKQPVTPWSSRKLLAALAWVGVVLTAAALLDYALAMFPTHFRSGEWEFGTIGQIFAGLPLLALGLASIWLSGAGMGRRWMLLVSGTLFELAALTILVLLLVFALDVPLALKTTADVARSPVMKMILKTVGMAVLFGASFVYAGVLALGQARSTPAGEAV